MSNKKTATTRPASHVVHPPEPPRGLVAAYAAINMDGATPHAALKSARIHYPHARTIFDLLHGRIDEREVRGQDLLIEEELQRATDAYFAIGPETRALVGEGDDCPHRSPGLLSEASFHVGFAVCWLLMTTIHGGGAR